jgi:LysR family transcriptional activator of nhaA
VAPLPEPAAAELIAQKTMVILGPVDDVYEELWLTAGERRFQNPVASQIFKSFSLDTEK